MIYFDAAKIVTVTVFPKQFCSFLLALFRSSWDSLFTAKYRLAFHLVRHQKMWRYLNIEIGSRSLGLMKSEPIIVSRIHLSEEDLENKLLSDK